MEESNKNIIIQEGANMSNNNINNVQAAPTFSREEVDAYFNSLPSGFRFVPTDEELILFYLERKVKGEPLPVNRFRDININEHDPDDFTKEYKLLRESEWYIFTSRQKKYPNGSRPDRVTKAGYWKATGIVKPIEFKGKKIGSKRNMDFFVGKHNKGTKSEWKMHEYLLEEESPHNPSNDQQAHGNTTVRTDQEIAPLNDDVGEASDNKMKLNDWVLCKIYKNTRPNKNKNKSCKIPQTAEPDHQGQRVLPVTTETTHSFSGQPGGQPSEHHQDQRPLLAEFTDHHSVHQGRPAHQNQPPLVGSNSSTLNHHFGMSPSTTTLFNRGFGEPLHYAPFENEALRNCSVSMSNMSYHNQNMGMGHGSHVSQMMNSSSSFAMQDYSDYNRELVGPSSIIRDGSRISKWTGMEYQPPHEAQEEDAYFDYDYVQGDDSSFDDGLFDQYLSPPDDGIPHDRGEKRHVK